MSMGQDYLDDSLIEHVHEEDDNTMNSEVNFILSCIRESQMDFETLSQHDQLLIDTQCYVEITKALTIAEEAIKAAAKSNEQRREARRKSNETNSRSTVY